MAKVSLLPPAGPLDGSETIPLVQGGETKRANFGDYTEDLMAPYVSLAQIAAAAATYEPEVIVRNGSARDTIKETAREPIPTAANVVREWNLNGNTRDASTGVITIAAGSWIETPAISKASEPFENANYAKIGYIWAWEVAPDAARGPLTHIGYFNGVSGNLLPHSAFAQTSPGVYSGSFEVANAGRTSQYTNATFRIKNTTADDIDVIVALTGKAYSDRPILATVARSDELPAQYRELPDNLECWRRWERQVRSITGNRAGLTLAADGSLADDSGTGTPASPKKTLAGIASIRTLVAGDALGLRRGSIYTGSITTPGGALTGGLTIRGYDNGATVGPLPVLDPMDEAPSGSWTLRGATDTYQYEWSEEAGSNLANDGYNFVNVEIIAVSGDGTWADRSLLETLFVTAPSLSQYSSVALATAECEARPSSCVVEEYAAGQWRAIVHLPDSDAPGTTYTLRVTKRYKSLLAQGLTSDMEARSLCFITGSDGYGVGLPHKSLLVNSSFLHQNAHSVVQNSGIAENLYFYAPRRELAKYGPSSGHTFYADNGTGQNWLYHSIVADGGEDGGIAQLQSHSTGAADRRYETGRIDGLMARATPRKYGYEARSVAAFKDTKQVRAKNIYIRDGCVLSPGTDGVLEDFMIDGVGKYACPKIMRNGIIKLHNWGDDTNINNRGMGPLAAASFLEPDTLLENNLFIYEFKPLGYAGYAAIQASDGVANLLPAEAVGRNFTHRRNIHVVYGVPTTTLMSYGGLVSDTPQFASDDNIYIFLPKPGMPLPMTEPRVNATGRALSGGPTMLGVYRFRTELPAKGIETNSHFLDRRDSLMGIDELFVDYANYNLNFANTEFGNHVARICREQNIGPDWRPRSRPEFPTPGYANSLIAAL